MIKVKGLDHININVKNLEESKKFYEQLFGFKLYEEGIRPSGVKYALVGEPNQIYFAMYEDSENPIEGGFCNHFGLHVDNFDSLMENLKSLNVKREFGDDIIEYPHSRSIYIFDPNGIEIELSEKFGGGMN